MLIPLQMTRVVVTLSVHCPGFKLLLKNLSCNIIVLLNILLEEQQKSITN